MRTFRRLLIVLLLVALLPATAAAEEMSSLEQDLEAAREERERTQSRISELRGQEGDARQRLAVAEAELAGAEADLNHLRAELAVARDQLAQAQQRVDEARAELAVVTDELGDAEDVFLDAKARLESRLRAAFKYGPVSFAEAFSGVRDIADFISSSQYVAHVLNGDRDIVEEFDAALTEVEEQRRRAQVLRERAEAEEREAAEVTEQIEAATLEQSRLTDVVADRRRQHAAALEELRSDRASLEGHLAGLEAESARIQQRLAELAAQQAEAEWRRAVERWEACQADNDQAQDDYEDARAAYEEALAGHADAVAEAEAAGETPPEAPEAPEEPRLRDCGEQPPSSPPSSAAPSGSWIRPVNGAVSSPFGPRWGRFHYGVDLANSMGTTVRSAQSGQVAWTVTGCNASSSWGCGGGFGNYVVVDHGGGFATVYAHLASVNVSSGQSVSAGRNIGTVGNSGNSYGPHLHFELYDGGTRKNPCNYIAC